MSLRLFEFAVIKQPLTSKEGKVIDEGAILVGIETVLAKDETQVQLLASRAIPDEEMENLDRLEVVVRPFDPSYAVVEDDEGYEIGRTGLAHWGGIQTFPTSLGSGLTFTTSPTTSSSSYTSVANIASATGGGGNG